MPALAFSFAMLAKLGPLDEVEDDFCIPAPTLAAFQSEPKASPPAALDAGGLGALADEVNAVGEVTEDADDTLGLPVAAGDCT